jgi:hypothetical protein
MSAAPASRAAGRQIALQTKQRRGAAWQGSSRGFSGESEDVSTVVNKR